MDKRKFKSKSWHHRVPDFELVYCGPTKSSGTRRNGLRRGNKQERRLKRRKSLSRTVPASTQ